MAVSCAFTSACPQHHAACQRYASAAGSPQLAAGSQPACADASDQSAVAAGQLAEAGRAPDTVACKRLMEVDADYILYSRSRVQRDVPMIAIACQQVQPIRRVIQKGRLHAAQ